MKEMWFKNYMGMSTSNEHWWDVSWKRNQQLTVSLFDRIVMFICSDITYGSKFKIDLRKAIGLYPQYDHRIMNLKVSEGVISARTVEFLMRNATNWDVCADAHIIDLISEGMQHMELKDTKYVHIK